MTTTADINPDHDRAMRIVADALDPPADIHATTAYRKHLAGVLTRRGLAEAAATIGAFA